MHPRALLLLLLLVAHGMVAQRTKPTVPLRFPTLVRQNVASWAANASYNDMPTQVFDDITIPEVFLSLYPTDEASFDYPIFQRMLDTGYIEICDSLDAYFPNYVNQTCEQIFCNASATFVPLVVAWTNYLQTPLARLLYVSLHNYCLYCSYPTVRAFRSTMQHHVQQLLYKNDSSVCPHFAYPMLAAQVIQNTTTTTTMNQKLLQCNGQGQAYLHFNGIYFFPEHPYICYCNRTSQFGYQCDAFTYAFIPMRFIIFPYALLIINAVLSVFWGVFVVIPYVFAKLQQVTDTCKQKQCNGWSLLHVLLGDLKAYSICTSVVSIWLQVPEHVLSLAYYSIYQRSTVTEISAARVWTQYMSCYLLCLSLSFILVLWLRVVNGKPFSILQKCLLVFTYASQLIVFVTLSILSRIDNTGIKIASACIVPLYFIVFAIGLFVFGIKMYVQWRNVSKKYYTYHNVPWTKLKFTQFTIVANIFMFIMAVLLILLALILYVGWDILSPFMYLFITIVISIVSYFISFLMGYLLFSKKMFMELYSICCNKCAFQAFGYQSKGSDALDIVPAVASEYDSDPDVQSSVSTNTTTDEHHHATDNAHKHTPHYYASQDKKTSLLDSEQVYYNESPTNSSPFLNQQQPAAAPMTAQETVIIQ